MRLWLREIENLGLDPGFLKNWNLFQTLRKHETLYLESTRMAEQQELAREEGDMSLNDHVMDVDEPEEEPGMLVYSLPHRVFTYSHRVIYEQGPG